MITMSEKSLTEIKEQLGGLSPLFKAIGETLNNNCECHTCTTLRNVLIEMAKKHDLELALKRASKQP